jgi:hypothetical protein
MVLGIWKLECIYLHILKSTDLKATSRNMHGGHHQDVQQSLRMRALSDEALTAQISELPALAYHFNRVFVSV